MTGILLYLAGAPAVGKSTLMAELTSACNRWPRTDPIPHDVLLTRAQPGGPFSVTAGIEIGRRRPHFPGTDALSYAIAPAALDWLDGACPYALALAEGDRLATTGFLLGAQGAGWRVHLVYLHARQDILDARRAARGSTQDPVWAKGRATKAARLADRVADTGVQVLDLGVGTASPADLAGAILGWRAEIEEALTGLGKR